MADSILGMLFEISADPTKAEAALAELKASTVAESAEISSVWSSAMDAITGPAGLALGAVVGLGGGMLEMANKAAEAGEKVLLVSQQTGIATEKLGGLQLAAKLTNTDFESVTRGLEIMSRNLSAFASTASVGGKALAAIGIKATDSHGQLKPMDVLLSQIADKFALMPDGSDKAAIAMAIFGRSGAALIPILDKGSSGIQDLTNQAVKMGTAFSQEKAEELSRYAEQVKLLKNQFDGMALSIGEAVVPAMTSLFSAFAGQIGPLGELSRNLDQIEGDINKYGAAVDETGRVWTKADLEQRKAQQSQESFRPAIAGTTDALKSQIAAINQSVAGVGVFNVHLKETKKSAEDVSGVTSKAAAAIAKAAEKSREFWTGYNQLAADGIHLTKDLMLPAIVQLAPELAKLNKEIADAASSAVFKQMKDLAQGLTPGGAEAAKSGLPAILDATAAAARNAKVPLDALDLSAKYLSLHFGPKGEVIEGFRGLLPLLGQIPGPIRGVSVQVRELASAAEQASLQIFDSTNRELQAYGFTAQALQGIYKGMLNDLGQYLSQKAALKAAEQIAEALGSWPNFAAMAQHFAAAAAWEALGAGVAGLAGAVTGGGRSSSASVSPAGASPGGQASRGASSISPSPQGYGAGGPAIVVNIDNSGAMLGSNADKALISQIIGGINNAVSSGGQILISSRSTGRPNVTAGG